MKKKYKVFLLTLGVFLLISLSISISYAYYLFSVSQEGVNALNSDCFKITYSDSNAINLLDTIPLSEEEASNLTPYTFTINNICNYAIDYNVNIETLDETTIDLNAIRYKLDNKVSKLLGSIEDNDLSTYVNNNVSSSKTIANGSMKANSSKTFNLKMWVDENSTKEQAANKIFKSKVVVYSSLIQDYSESILINGNDFNKTIKQLAGNTNASSLTYDKNVTSILKSETPPSENTTYINISDTNSDNPVYAWYDNGTVYIYSKSTIIYLNENSAYQFANFSNLVTLDLSIFDTSKVTNMFHMFSSASSLISLDLSNFDTSKVTDMAGLFYRCNNITSLDLSNFNTSKVTDMSDMFYQMKSLSHLDLSSFDTSSVIDMMAMFYMCNSIASLDLSNFDTSKVTNMSNMFYYMKSLTHLDLSNFDTSKVTDMSNMFNASSLTDLDLSSFNTSNVTNMSKMFYEMQSLITLDLSNFDTSKVTDMSNMFYRMRSLVSLKLSNFNTSKVTNMSNMFTATSLTELDLSSFDTSKVTNMLYMFSGMDNLTKIYVGNNWSIASVVSSLYMFRDDTNLIGGSGTVFDSNHTDAEYARVDDPDNGKPGYLTLKTN